MDDDLIAVPPNEHIEAEFQVYKNERNEGRVRMTLPFADTMMTSNGARELARNLVRAADQADET